MEIKWPSFFRSNSRGLGGLFSSFALWNTSTNFNSYGSDLRKLKIAFSNPAVLKVFALQCDLFSLANIYVYQGEEEVEGDPALSMFAAPNPFQGRQQWLYDFMFWNMIGNDYLYCDSKLVNDSNKLYWLIPDRMQWPDEFKKAKDKLIFSKSSLDALNRLEITYRYSDGTSTKLPWAKIKHWSDLTNGVGNWFKGNSRIDALCKIIDNSEEALNSMNTNRRYGAKFMVAGQADPKNVQQRPLTEPEQEDIETKMNGSKQVHALKSMVEIKRFVENYAQLKLEESYLNDYFLIGSMYGIPKDVLEAYNSSTYENQEKARGAHVSYCLQSKGDDLVGKLSTYFGYDKKKIVISWDHLPFMQVFEKDKADVNFKKSQTILNLQKAGVDTDDINKFLDTKFKKLEPKNTQANGTQPPAPAEGDPGTEGGQQGGQK